MNEQRMWRVDTVLLREAYNNIFAPCSSYFDIRKEVINKMAIDYKKEWEKLLNKHGNKGILEYGVTIKLGTLMRNQIHNTINRREELMKIYMRENIMTDINGADKHHHHVKITNARKPRGPIGTMYIHKKDFDAWCKRKQANEK